MTCKQQAKCCIIHGLHSTRRKQANTENINILPKDEHFLAMQSAWNAMIKIHSENIVPLPLPLPKWTDDTKSESIEKGDLIYMMKREQSTFALCKI